MTTPEILILEDEAAAARRLQRLVETLHPDWRVLEVLDCVDTAIEWLSEHPAPDLILMDIHLADGSSFDIFREVEVRCPVIFTTAYDQYAIQAFKVNSIDYILKPVKEEELRAALNKWRDLRGQASPPADYTPLLQELSTPSPSYQKRLVIRFGQHLKAIDIEEAAYFYIESRVTMMRTHQGKEYPVDHNLDQLEGILDPARFFRINRKFIVHVQAIDQMYVHSKSRVRLVLEPPIDTETIVSAERAARFKDWLKG
ncbi:MAG: DNA-binding response regulator [Bacteroidetes bacterium]|nr:MAG: DNA-binding response regulator [Bacteroidota bacterium]